LPAAQKAGDWTLQPFIKNGRIETWIVRTLGRNQIKLRYPNILTRDFNVFVVLKREGQCFTQSQRMLPGHIHANALKFR
jgi:hypothetical protein